MNWKSITSSMNILWLEIFHPITYWDSDRLSVASSRYSAEAALICKFVSTSALKTKK